MKAAAQKLRAPDSEGDDQERVAEDEIKKGTWQIDQLQRRLYWTQLQNLLRKDPVLKILKPELIRPLRGPATEPKVSTDKLEAIQRLIQLLQEAGFVPGAFDAQVLLDCDLNQVITASRSLFKMLVPLTGNYDSADRDPTTTVKVEEKRRSPAVSSQYASAESDADESDHLEIRRMSLGPSGAALLRSRHGHTAPDVRASDSSVTQFPAIGNSDQIQIYVEKAVEKLLQDQHRQRSRAAQIG